MGNLVFQATLGGQVNLVGPNTASTYNLNVPAVSSTIATTSGTETLTNKTLTNPVINGFTGDTSVVNIGSNQFYKDTSGNIGIGVTPKTWYTGLSSRALELNNCGLFTINGTETDYFQNAYLNSSISWTYSSSNYATRYTQNTGIHQWFNAASGTAGNPITWIQAMTLDTSGNFMVGTTSSAGRLTVANSAAADVQVTFKALTNNYASILNLESPNDNGAIYNYLCSNTTGVTQHWKISGGGAANTLAFSTAGTERARIDSSGNLLVAVTSTTIPGYNNTTTGTVINANNPACFSQAKTDFVQVINQNTIDGSNYDLIGFRTGGAARGNILSNGTGVSYNSNSDYRLKENIAPMTGALAAVARLKPCTYTWKETGQDGQGFIAHELAEVVPDAVSGEKDAVNEDGSIKPQGVDTSFLVATLTAAIQEQQTIIETLTNRIAALENK